MKAAMWRSITNGSSPLSFEGINADDYYVVVRHRNHLGMMTADPVSLSSSAEEIDFTTPATPTFGINAQLNIAGKTAMWSGNTIADEIIKYSGLDNDRDPVLFLIGGLVPTNIEFGYHLEDVNMDGQVKYSGLNNDRDIILFNIGGLVPTNTILERLP